VSHERHSRQGARTDLVVVDGAEEDVAAGTSGKVLPEVKPNDRAAESLGASRPHLDKAATVVKAIDTLAAIGMPFA
jgi:hypothetical protein